MPSSDRENPLARRAALVAESSACGGSCRTIRRTRRCRFFVDFQLWQRWPACRDFAFGSPAAAIAAAMMGSRTVCFYHDHLLVKEPETAERTPWHHDQPYYPVDGGQICSIWLPLDPVGRETAVEYIKGSHRWGRWFAPRFFR